MFRQLVIFVEGENDEVFIETIIKTRLDDTYDLIKIEQSSQLYF